MRRSIVVACGSAALAAAAAACAASGTHEEPQSSDAGSDTTVVLDSGAAEPERDADAEPEASIDTPKCSEAGWCPTSLPEADLLMKDIWTFPGHAVAVAESPTLGVRVLEWTDAEAKWSYIDDGTQNESGLGLFVGKIWMPNQDEIYYGVSPGYIYHGTRPAAPAKTWSWTRDRLANSSGVNVYDGNPIYWQRKGSAPTPSLGVWGTSPDDIYAWFKDTIYHFTSVDGGAPKWIAEYAATDSDAPGTEQLFFFGAAGTSPDDVWFSGGRSRSGAGCALLVRKTSGVYQRVADGALAGNAKPCTARAGARLIGGAEGWLTDIQALGPGAFIALKGARDVVRLSAEGDSYSVAVAAVPSTVSTVGLNSLTTMAGDVWLGGAGLVVRGASVWDGGAFELSTLWQNGTPVTSPIWQVRGTSNTNLWAIGVRNALHKTTP